MDNDEDDDAPEAMRFIPFFEPEFPDAPHNEVYRAGFKDEDDERWGVVPLPRSIVDRVVLLENFLQPQINIDGTARVWPADVPDELFAEMQDKGNTPIIPLDTLIAERLDTNMDEPDYGKDGVVPAYKLLRERLKAALDLVESEILRRTTRHPGSQKIN
jgi:hypothetical protein